VNPQFSVIFLTTLIGAGQGMFIALFATELGELLELLPPARRPWFYFTGSLLVVLLTGAGLVASFFHLGRPERAWRSAARWRTSWLSREVIVLPAFMGVVVLYALAQFFHVGEPLAVLPSGAPLNATLVLGLAGALLALALFVCTAMIYACLPFLREWHTPLTVANYLLLGCASGSLLAATYAMASHPALVRFLALCALCLTLLAAVSRGSTLLRNARLRPGSTLQTAIGIKHPRIVQISPGFSAGSFNTREFFHGRSPALVRAVTWTFVVCAFAAPIALVGAALAGAPSGAIVAALAFQCVGLLAERWHFFAQANHPQNLYYGAAAVESALG
jgi:DMSO reductase anchor subunit